MKKGPGKGAQPVAAGMSLPLLLSNMALRAAATQLSGTWAGVCSKESVLLAMVSIALGVFESVR